MPNAEKHAVAGFIVTALGYVVVKKFQGEEINLGHALAWGAVGAGVALIPDVIEPAVSPTHRSFAHSAITSGLVTYAVKSAWDDPNNTSDQKAVATSMGAAYLSHLLLDATTPAGLPII